MKHLPDALRGIADWVGIEFDDDQVDQVVGYAEWLITEAVAIGGIGPSERERIWDRHIADSLAFGVGMSPTAAVLDVGSGVGLPGIPLAIAYRRTAVTLLDRSRRRTDALKRVARMLDLPVEVVTGDVGQHRGAYDRVVMRAALRPDRAATLRRLVVPGGDIVVGIGRGERPSNSHVEGSLVHVDPRVLENGAWLFMIPVA